MRKSKWFEKRRLWCVFPMVFIFLVVFSIGNLTWAVSLTGKYAVDKKKFWPKGYDRDEIFLFLAAQEECGPGFDHYSQIQQAGNFEGWFALMYDAAFMFEKIGNTKQAPENKGMLFSVAGLWKDAAKEFKKAAKTNPEEPDFWAACAVAYHAAGKYKDSMKSFEKVLALDPQYLEDKEIQNDIYQSSKMKKSVLKSAKYKDTPKRLTCMGFSFLPPPSESWNVDKKAKYEVYLSKKTGRSDFTVILMANLSPRQGDMEIQQLAQYLEETPDKSLEAERFTPLTKDVTTVEIKEAECAKKTFSFEDRGVPYAPGKVFITEGYDMFCEHLNYEDVLVHLGISQRYEQKEDIINLDEVLTPILESLEFEPSY